MAGFGRNLRVQCRGGGDVGLAVSGIAQAQMSHTPAVQRPGELGPQAKGGIVVAIARELNIPIRYVGIGEKVDDLLPFDAEKFIASLFEK